MIVFLREPLAVHVRFDEQLFHVELTDGRVVSIPLSWYPRFIGASKTQLENYRIGGGGAGIHWDDLDEDISVSGLIEGAMDGTAFARRYWNDHPEHRPLALKQTSLDVQRV